MTPAIKRTLLKLACSAYGIALHAYPRPFRMRFGVEMTQVFRDEWRATLARGSWRAWLGLIGRTSGDLLMNATRERLATLSPLSAACLIAALGVGVLAGYVDRHNAHETYPTLAVMLVGSFALGLAQPHWPWRWALLIALFVPFYGPVATLGTRLATPGSWAMLAVALVPGLIGAYGAALLRRAVTHTPRPTP